MYQGFDPQGFLGWVDTLSPTRLALFCSLAMVGVTWFGIIFFKPFIRRWLRKQPGSNDLVNYASAGFSLFYGLLLGLQCLFYLAAGVGYLFQRQGKKSSLFGLPLMFVSLNTTTTGALWDALRGRFRATWKRAA